MVILYSCIIHCTENMYVLELGKGLFEGITTVYTMNRNVYAILEFVLTQDAYFQLLQCIVNFLVDMATEGEVGMDTICLDTVL